MSSEQRGGGEVLRIRLPDQVSFLNRAAYLTKLNEIPHGSSVILDARDTHYIDPDVLDLFRDFESETAPAHELELNLVGFKEEYEMSESTSYTGITTREVQAEATPEGVLELLRAGNQRFVAGESIQRDHRRHVEQTAAGQYPLAVVLACMDSRVSTEMAFDVGLGDIFSVRVAGNIASDEDLGSMEYGCAVAGAKLLLVLGHTRCGAVTAAVDLAVTGSTAKEATGCENLDAVTGPIIESVRAETETTGDRTGSNKAFVDRVAVVNVRRSMAQIRERSGTLRDLIDAGKVLLTGALYDVETGRVDLLDGDETGA